MEERVVSEYDWSLEKMPDSDSGHPDPVLSRDEAEDMQKAMERTPEAVRLNQKILQLENRNKQLEFSNWKLEEEKERAVLRLQEMEKAYQDMIHSRTYRVTVTLQKLLDAAKATKVGGMFFQALWYLKNNGLRAGVRNFFKFLKRKAARNTRARTSARIGAPNAAVVPNELLPCEETVSVVIPTYQAGKEFEELLRVLKMQQNIKNVEIVIVDSGSKDDTVKLAREAGCVVVEIPQAEFSHSHARNLGAEHASGAFILLMTQDAMPDSSLWLSGFLQPLLRGDAVAASCKEIPRSDCDLLGAFAIWNHSEFMGIQTRDRMMQLPATEDYISLRTNAQLSDVACIIRADLLKKYPYRGSYAEDLDLGLRLIRDGYRIALLSSVQVIHSHNRPAFYYFKRSIVDNLTMKSILADFPLGNLTETEAASRILTEYMILAGCCEECNKKKLYNSYTELCNEIYRKMCLSRDAVKNYTQADVESAIEMDLIPDNSLKDVIRAFFDKYSCVYFFDDASLREQEHVLIRMLPEYMAAAGLILTEDTPAQVFEMMIRHFAQLAGSLLASYGWHHRDKISIMNEMIKKYQGNV